MKTNYALVTLLCATSLHANPIALNHGLNVDTRGVDSLFTANPSDLNPSNPHEARDPLKHGPVTTTSSLSTFSFPEISKDVFSNAKRGLDWVLGKRMEKEKKWFEASEADVLAFVKRKAAEAKPGKPGKPGPKSAKPGKGPAAEAPPGKGAGASTGTAGTGKAAGTGAGVTGTGTGAAKGTRALATGTGGGAAAGGLNATVTVTETTTVTKAAGTGGTAAGTGTPPAGTAPPPAPPAGTGGAAVGTGAATAPQAGTVTVTKTETSSATATTSAAAKSAPPAPADPPAPAPAPAKAEAEGLDDMTIRMAEIVAGINVPDFRPRKLRVVRRKLDEHDRAAMGL